MSKHPMTTIQIPLVYQAQAKYGKERNFRTVYYGEWVPFPVKELGSDDAPVFARWDYMGGWPDEREVKGREIVRVFEGAFYRPYRGHAKRLTTPHMDTDALSQWNEHSNPLYELAAAGGDQYDGDRAKALKEFVSGDGNNLALSDAREIANDTRDKEITRLHELGDTIILIDGKIWERCPEPVLSLDYQHSSLNSSVHVGVLFGGSSTGKVELFRLDDRDGLIDFLRIARNLDDPRRSGTIVDDVANIEILIPEALNAEPERQSLLRTCEIAINESASDVLRRGRDATNAWHDLDAIVKSAKTDLLAIDVDEALEAFRAFCTVYAETSPLGYDHYDDRVALYSNRIENRPIQSNHHKMR
jgi:hypothetical protein